MIIIKKLLQLYSDNFIIQLEIFEFRGWTNNYYSFRELTYPMPAYYNYGLSDTVQHIRLVIHYSN